MPLVDRLTNLACSIKQSSYKIMTTNTYTISSSKVLDSLLNLSWYSSLANICLSKASLHLGAWSYQSKGSISGGCNWIFITIKYNNINGGISTIQLYWSSSGQLLSRTHYSSIRHSHKITRNKWSSIHWSSIISSCGSLTHPFQSRGSPTHYTIGIMAVLCIVLLGSLRRYHQSCSDLTLGGLVAHYPFERTTYRPVTPPIKSRLLLKLWNFLLNMYMSSTYFITLAVL